MLKGKRVTLRLMERRDLELLRRWRNSPEVFQFFEAKEQISEFQQEKWFEKISLDRSSYYFVIEDQGEPVGVTNIKNIHPVHRTASWGIYLAPEGRNRGLVPVEAAILLLDYCFNCLNVRKVYGDVLAENHRALHFDKGLGCQEEGVRSAHVYHNGRYVDLVLIGLFKDRYFEATQKHREALFEGE